MKRSLLLALVLVLSLSFQLRADDTSIFGTASISVSPNVLIIFDTSGSMGITDVPGDYYNPSTTYSGSYTKNAVYQKVCGWGCSYNPDEPFADDVGDLNCAAVKTALETTGYVTGAVMDSGGGYACGGSQKDLYLGNWINYDASGTGTMRSRISVAKEVIANVINDTANVRFGLMRFNSNAQGGYIVAECGTSKTTLINALNALPASGNTPLAETLAEAGLYFAGKQSWFNGTGGSYSSNCDNYGTGCQQYTSPMQYRCQKNYIIVMTDGEPTSDDHHKLRDSGAYIDGDTIGDYDSDGKSGKLDDVSKYLYENDLSAILGTVGGSFEKQNIITYTIGFQSQQDLLGDTARNGGGLYYTAQSISGLTAAFQQIIAGIADVNAVFVSPVVPVSRMNRTYAGNSLYVGFFKPQNDGRWAGNIKKYGLDTNGDILDADSNAATLADGTIKDNARSYWSTSADGPDVLTGGIGQVLLDQASRNLYTYMGTSTDLTNSTNAFSTSNGNITASTLDVSTSEKDTVINDIHGASRSWKLGDILHSQPAVVHYDTNGDNILDDAFIFSGSNGGMMHCFKDSNGSEEWAFIPPDQLTRLKLFSDGSVDHKYFVDSAPAVYQDASQKILFFGERRGGYNYYALDVTTYNVPSYLYKITPNHLVNLDGDGIGGADGANATLGQSWCLPGIHKIKTSVGSDTVFLMGGGYDDNQDQDTPSASDSEGRAVFAIKVADGTVSSLNVNAGYYNAMTHCIVDVTGFDTNASGYTNRVYAGDLGGNIFAFEDDNGDGNWSRRKLFSASAVDGVQRKIFYAPDAVGESDGETISFGTGDRADPEETGVVNRIYVIKNNWENLSTFSTITESDLVDVTDNLLVLGTPTEQAAVRDALAASKGWYIRLEDLGEKCTSAVTIFGGVLYFTTYTPEAGGGGSSSDPCISAAGRGTARFYALNYSTGTAAYDYSVVEEKDAEDNIVAKGKLDRSKAIGTSIASAPVVAILESGARIYIGIEGGVAKEDPIVTSDMNIYYWREITD